MPAPNTPQDILDRLRSLERQVRTLSSQVNIRPALNTIVGGSVTVSGGGTLVVRDVDSTAVFQVGKTTPDVAGQPQSATIIRRMDGSVALSVYDPTGAGPQGISLYDKNSNQILTDDTVGGGLSTPYLPIPLPGPADRSQWQTTTAAAFTNVGLCKVFLHHPKLYVNIVQGFTSGTGSGQFQLTINGVVAVAPAADTDVDGTYAVPNWNWTGAPQQVVILLQAKRISGTGTYGVAPRAIYGRQS